MHACFQGLRYIFHTNTLFRTVADAARRAQEDHRCRYFRGEDHSIVAGAANHAVRLTSGLADCIIDEVNKTRIHGDSRLIEYYGMLHADFTPCGDYFGATNHGCHCGFSDVVQLVAGVEGERDLSRNDVGCAGSRDDGTYGCDKPMHAGCLLFDLRNPFGRGGKCVVAQSHRSCAGMIGASEKSKIEPALANDCFHRSERKAQIVKHWALFDVKLEIPKNVANECGLRDRVRIKPELLDRRSNCNSVGVFLV